MPLPSRTTGTKQVHTGTLEAQNDSSIQEPICRIILLYQKERWIPQTSTGLLPSQPMDHKEQIPTTAHSSTSGPTQGMHTIYQIQHMLGLQ